MPFLNYMSILAEKAGGVHIRVGGNTQEFAYVVDELEDGKMLEKDKGYLKNPVRLGTRFWEYSFTDICLHVERPVPRRLHSVTTSSICLRMCLRS